MKLHVGERLHGTGPSHQPGGYLVTEVVRETPWYGLYTGKKILYNFDFTAKRVRETDDKEWLDVYLRTLHYSRLDDPEEVAQRRRLARSEVAILGNRGSNLWPEPIDLLEIENTRDAFAFAPGDDDHEPIVVFARPAGQPLGDWQQAAVPVASILSVLAELLELVRQSHAEGLLLQGLGPAAILIDRADRVHYIGSDMVAEQRELRRVRRFFSAERYPRGFAAPEFFDPTAQLTPRSDLYAWGTLAYFLFTGHQPWQIALEQGRPWAQFQDLHFERLEKALRQIPPAHVRDWAEQLGLPGPALLESWPGNCIAMMRWLLDADPGRRPRSADEVRAWMVALPPAQVHAVVAIDLGGGETRLYLDAHALEAGSEITVRRSVGQPPAQPEQGDLAYSGPMQPDLLDSHAPLTDEPFYYTVFSRKATAGGAVYSSGVSARAIEFTAADVVPFLESAATGALDEAPPPQVELCFRALDPVGLAEMMLTSRRPVVRNWALRRIGDLLVKQPWPELEALARRSLRDADDELRRRAVQILWKLSPRRSEKTLLALVKEMGGGQIDDAIRAAQTLQHSEIPQEPLQRVLEQLEEERPTTCPICGVPLSRRERADHLRIEHDHVEVDGGMWPRPQAEARLWERVFGAGDAEAQRQLLQLFGDDEPGRAAYAEALESQLATRDALDDGDRGASSGAAPHPHWGPWLACLRPVLSSQHVLTRLLHSESDRARAAGNALILPELGERLRSAGADAAAVGRAIEETLPGRDLANERVRLCAQLPQLGVDPAVAGACQAKFRDELPVRCPECPAQVRSFDLEIHLRRAHGVFQFRGVRRTYSETRDHLLGCLCGARPDVQAWRALTGLAEDRYGEAASERLALWVCGTIKGLGRERRDAVIETAADAIARTANGAALAVVLLGEAAQPAWKNLARQLALEIVARAEKPWSTDAQARIKPYLSAKDIPGETRRRATAGLLRAHGLADPNAVEILQAFVSATSKHRAVERLRELEQIVGQAPVIEQLIAALEDRIRMTCPRCQLQLERLEMVKHLWDKHRLLLDGRQVREPWRVLADWVVDYGLEKDPALLERCRDLAIKTDPEEGPIRLQRLLVRQGVEDREAWNALLNRARQRGASLCPHCYAHVPVPSCAPPAPLTEIDGLAGHGYGLEIDERGLAPRLRITGPHEILFDAKEPGGGLTPVGGLLALAAPVALAVWGILWALPLDMAAPMRLFLAIGLSLFPDALIYWLWPHRSLRRRRLDAAWHLLVPELLAKPLTSAAVGFLEGLATNSYDRYLPDDEVLDAAQAAVERDWPNAPALVALWRLHLQNLAERGDDMVTAAADLVGAAFAGKWPLRLVSLALAELGKQWSKGAAQRLQALVCVRAAAAGLTGADLADLVQARLTLGPVLQGADLDHLAQLRHLASLAGRLPLWLPKGDSVLELAGDAANESIFERRPDLLMSAHETPIYLSSRGVWLKDVCIAERPDRIEVNASRGPDGAGHAVVIGKQRVWFTSNPKAVVDDLERWLRFYFEEFLQAATRQARQRGGDASRRMWRANAVACPECQRPVVPVAGEVGLRIADAAEMSLAS